MKNPKVIFVLKDIKEITAIDSSLTTKASIERAVKTAVADAESLALKGLNYLSAVIDKPSTSQMKAAWNGDAKVRAFFGEAPGKARMQNACDRLNRVYKRLRDKQLRIRLKPQEGKKWSGHNNGGPVSPRQFVLFPAWFKSNPKGRSAILIHELLHDWHFDHKVKNPASGKRETAYGPTLAKELAKKRPGDARRNPENFEQFCRSL